MAIDTHPEAQRPPHPHPQQRNARRNSSSGRWWKRGLLAIGVVAVIAAVAALIPGASSSRRIGPKLTHTITRGDLIVTVTEQGILESSENTEIKCQVRGESTVTWVIEGGTEVKPGDVLVRLDTLAIEDAINERSKYAHWSRSAAERSQADVARAELAIPEYLEGRYRSELMTLEKDMAIAESNLRTARNMLAHARMMAEQGYVSKLEVEEKTFAVTQAESYVEIKKTEVNVLQEFAKKMELETLNGNLKASKAKHEADKERAKMDAVRRDLGREELEHCVVKADRSGLVVYPSAARWFNAPEIAEGATVHMDQVLLLMPDLAKMQVKVGIRESAIGRITSGLAARVTLPDQTLDGEVSSVALVTAPTGWWTGNVVKYDTIIKLPSVAGLRPGMSAEVEVIVDRHQNVLRIPVAAVVETELGAFCWVRTAEGDQRRALTLGDTNGTFTLVEAGLQQGDQVVLNPLALEVAQTEVGKPLDAAKPRKPVSPDSRTKSTPPESGSDKPASDSKRPADTKPEAAKPQAESKLRLTGAQIIKFADKNGDGVLTTTPRRQSRKP